MFKKIFAKPHILISTLFVGGLLLRLYLATWPAQAYDISTYEAWGRIMLEKGPKEFFVSTWSDYLPLPIYFCSLIVLIADALSADFALIFKIVVSLLELILISSLITLYKGSRKLLLAGVLLFSPALIGDSAAWGQLDTLPALLTGLSLSLLVGKDRVISSAILFGLAVAIKPVMLVTLPIFLIILITKLKLRDLTVFASSSFLVFLAPAIFVGDNPFVFLVQKGIEQGSTYPYTTINAWNLWSLRPLHNSWPPDNQQVLGLSAHTTGLLLFGVSAIAIIRTWWQRKWRKSEAFELAGLLLLSFYIFATRMHERHLLFTLPFLALGTLYNRALYAPLAVFTATFTLNLYGAYYWVEHNQTWPYPDWFLVAMSWLNVATAIIAIYRDSLAHIFHQLKNWIITNKHLSLILLFALGLRIILLWTPNTYIFDEVYHSFTAREYLADNIEAWEWWTTPPEGVAYEWTHPPIAKYGMVLGMLIFGENAFGWRIGSAIMGTLSLLALYLLVHKLTGNRRAASLATALVAVEGLHLAQSRVGMNDMYLLTFYLWSLYAASTQKWKAAALLYGLALASKWSALYGLIPLAVLYLHQFWLKGEYNLKRIAIALLDVIRLLLVSVIVYILTFIPFLLGHSFAELWELHRQMWHYHTHLVATHDYQSTPKEWIFGLRPVWYFVEYGERIRHIYALANPLILWLGLGAALANIWLLKRFYYSFFLLCYLIFVVPWVFSPRIMFFYHYLPSATFLTVLLALWLSDLDRKIVYTVLALIALVSLLIAPALFGIGMPPSYWDTLHAVFPSWK